MIDYKALHEQCRREGKSTLDLDDLAAGHPVAEAELAEQRRWLECRYHGHDYEACEKYSGQVPCDHEALGTPEPDPIAASSKRCAEADCAGPEEPCRCWPRKIETFRCTGCQDLTIGAAVRVTGIFCTECAVQRGLL